MHSRNTAIVKCDLEELPVPLTQVCTVGKLSECMMMLCGSCKWYISLVCSSLNLGKCAPFSRNFLWLTPDPHLLFMMQQGDGLKAVIWNLYQGQGLSICEVWVVNMGPCSSVGNVLLGNWDSFFWRKGKTGHAVDCFFSAVSHGSLLDFLSTLSLACCAGLFQKLISELPCIPHVLQQQDTTRRYKDAQPELLGHCWALVGLNKQ